MNKGGFIKFGKESFLTLDEAEDSIGFNIADRLDHCYFRYVGTARHNDSEETNINGMVRIGADATRKIARHPWGGVWDSFLRNLILDDVLGRLGDNRMTIDYGAINGNEINVPCAVIVPKRSRIESSIGKLSIYVEQSNVDAIREEFRMPITRRTIQERRERALKAWVEEEKPALDVLSKKDIHDALRMKDGKLWNIGENAFNEFWRNQGISKLKPGRPRTFGK